MLLLVVGRYKRDVIGCEYHKDSLVHALVFSFA